MGKKLYEVIREITRKHLEENNGLVIGQCLSSVGWVNDTVPNCKGIVELPMTDVAGAGIAVGTALVGRRPIFVVRFQDFMLLNASIFVNYAAKSKDVFGKGTPIFIRSLGTESNGAGPTHSVIMHSLFTHMPGFLVSAPMTPKEYQRTWEVFMKNDKPMYVSEHRRSFNISEEMENVILPDADITLYGISNARLNLIAAAEIVKKDGIKCNVIHLYWLKPLELNENMLDPLKNTKLGLVVDPSFEVAGLSRSIAYELTKKTTERVIAMGAEDYSSGVAEMYENGTPSVEKIVKTIISLVSEKKSK